MLPSDSYGQSETSLQNICMKQPIIIDHDGQVDDLTALALIASSPQYEIKAVTICPADGYRDASILSSLKYLAYFNIKGVIVAGSDEEGINKFPEEWRQTSHRLANLPFWDQVDLDHSQNQKTNSEASD